MRDFDVAIQNYDRVLEELINDHKIKGKELEEWSGSLRWKYLLNGALPLVENMKDCLEILHRLKGRESNEDYYIMERVQRRIMQFSEK